jgi:hypothetical protein
MPSGFPASLVLKSRQPFGEKSAKAPEALRLRLRLVHEFKEHVHHQYRIVEVRAELVEEAIGVGGTVWLARLPMLSSERQQMA